MSLQRESGGGSGTGNQLSLRDEAKRWVELREERLLDVSAGLRRSPPRQRPTAFDPKKAREKLDTRKKPSGEIFTGSLARFHSVPFAIRFRNAHVDCERPAGPERFLQVSSLAGRRPPALPIWCKR
jgi:hypothetical protein